MRRVVDVCGHNLVFQKPAVSFGKMEQSIPERKRTLFHYMGEVARAIERNVGRRAARPLGMKPSAVRGAMGALSIVVEMNARIFALPQKTPEAVAEIFRDYADISGSEALCGPAAMAEAA